MREDRKALECLNLESFIRQAPVSHEPRTPRSPQGPQYGRIVVIGADEGYEKLQDCGQVAEKGRQKDGGGGLGAEKGLEMTGFRFLVSRRQPCVQSRQMP
jgi:hypothetical protein